ncbi:E3 ubiquitin-protein ligase TRIM45-like [Oculina patagonica]
MEALLKDLKEHVTCSICLDIYTDPKTIDCLHTFCCECLKEHALTSHRSGLYRCPECNAQVGIPEESRFDRLPNSFLHNSLLSLLAVRRSKDGNEISCSMCQKKSAEINYCFDCEKFMCPDCVKAHDLFRTAAFEGHKVTPVKQFQPEDYEALLKRQSFCSQKYHEREVTRFYCLQCQDCVCQVCIVTDHKSHDVVPLDKAADDEKANIIAEAERMKEKVQACSDVICQLEAMELELETNTATAKRSVSQTAEQMIAKIREREREAITALENTRVSRTEKLNSAKETAQSLKKQRNQAVEFANNLVERSTSVDIMQSKENLKQRYKELSEAQVPALPVSSFVRFVPTCAPENFSLGITAFNKIDVHRSTVEGLTENFQAGKTAEFSICPQTSEGEIRNNEQDQVEVLVEPADQVASSTTCKKEGGNFQVKFVPKVPGTYKIEVKINGEKLANSPFTVQVKERQFNVVGKLDLQGKVLQGPTGIAVNSKGLIALVDCAGHCILIFDKKGKFVRKFGCHGSNAGQFDRPLDVTYLNDDEILVADQCNHRIQQINVQTGNFVKSFGKEGIGDGEFKNPAGVCMDNKEHIVVAEHGNSRIQVLTKNGEPAFKFGDSGPEKLNNPVGCLCFKNIFIVTDKNNHCLKVFNDSGTFLYKTGGKGEANGQFKETLGLCIDKYDNLLVCDKLNGRIQQFTVEGTFTGKSTINLKLEWPWGITTMPDDRILIADYNGKQVYIMN